MSQQLEEWIVQFVKWLYRNIFAGGVFISIGWIGYNYTHNEFDGVESRFDQQDKEMERIAEAVEDVRDEWKLEKEKKKITEELMARYKREESQPQPQPEPEEPGLGLTAPPVSPEPVVFEDWLKDHKNDADVKQIDDLMMRQEAIKGRLDDFHNHRMMEQRK